MTDTNDARRSLPDPEKWERGLSDDAPAPDELFKALSNATRRRTLWFLVEHPETTFERITDTLVGWRAADNDLIGPKERERIALSLYHVHLPMLVDCGLVTHDTAEGEVRLSSASDPVRDVIQFSNRYERAVTAEESR